MAQKGGFGTFLFDTKKTDGRWWDGWNGSIDRLAAYVYLMFTIGPLIWFAALGIPREWFADPGRHRFLILAYGLVVALTPHIWQWTEASAFFTWSASRYTVDAERKEARDEFKTHADGVKAVWSGLIAAYVGILLKFAGS